MDEFSFSELLSYQAANTKIVNYENEFLFMSTIKNDENFTLRRRMSTAWLSALQAKYTLNANDEEKATRCSNQLREEGNAFYSSKAGRQKDVIIAGQRYTQAIFTADPNTEALALAYANRAMVLQELEFYHQAYDDCCSALETKRYPKRLLHKIKTRQGFCALYLKDMEKLRIHLEELEEYNLNNSFTKRVQELRVGLAALTSEIHVQKLWDVVNIKVNPTKEATKVVDSKESTRGRYMIATRDIKCREVIFSETASSFVPVGGCQMCQQCGATLMIPSPCHGCNGRVVYCSLKCRKAHLKVHRNECGGYRIRLFEQIGISYLALRVVLEELPTIGDLNLHATDATELWLDLTAPRGWLHTKSGVNYVQTLCMVTHLAKMPLPDITWFALVADLLVVYLKEYTNFFNSMSSTKLKQSDWELITSALILRHIGQFIVNAHTCISITPTCYDLSTANPFGFLLVPDVWEKPFHLRRGMLHMVSELREVSAANLPYLSICNHACAPNLRPKFSGCNFYAMADSDIESGKEIFNCYTLNYRKSLRKVRRSYLKDIYYFDCTCEQCQGKDPDEVYLKHHLYKCQQCREEFVPSINLNSNPFNWWLTEDENNVPMHGVSCTACAKKQDVKWYVEFKKMLKHTSSAEKRKKLLSIFKMVDDFLLEFHSLKLMLASELVNACIVSYTAGCEFTKSELNQIVKVLRFCLKGTADQCGVRSIEYVVTMTFMWDLLAMGKCQCTGSENADMLEALDVVSDEYRIVFLNYYKDYIDNK